MFVQYVSGSTSSPSGSIINSFGALYPNIGNGQQNAAVGSCYRDDRDGTMWMSVSGSDAAWVQLGPLAQFGSSAPTSPPVGGWTGSLYFQV